MSSFKVYTRYEIQSSPRQLNILIHIMWCCFDSCPIFWFDFFDFCPMHVKFFIRKKFLNVNFSISLLKIVRFSIQNYCSNFKIALYEHKPTSTLNFATLEVCCGTWRVFNWDDFIKHYKLNIDKAWCFENLPTASSKNYWYRTQTSIAILKLSNKDTLVKKFEAPVFANTTKLGIRKGE